MEVEENPNQIEENNSEENNFIYHKELNTSPMEDIYSTLSNISIYNIIIQNNKKK